MSDKSAPNRSAVILGCGYVGRRLALQLQTRGQDVSAVARSEASLAGLSAQGIHCQHADLDHADSLTSLPLQGCDLYYLAPPETDSPSGERRINNLLSALKQQQPAHWVLISTTGVYGDCQGAVVDETHPTQPQAPRSKRRLAVEQVAHAYCEQRQLPLSILRVPGIYGPERLPLARLQRGEPVLAAAESPWSNRVHVDDLLQACQAAISAPPGIYNISDGQPSTMTDWFIQVAAHCGLPRPTEISRAEAEQQLSAEMLSYLAESKRIDNRKMREVLGVVPRYPNLSSGLAACTPPLLNEEKAHAPLPSP